MTACFIGWEIWEDNIWLHFSLQILSIIAREEANANKKTYFQVGRPLLISAEWTGVHTGMLTGSARIRLWWQKNKPVGGVSFDRPQRSTATDNCETSAYQRNSTRMRCTRARIFLFHSSNAAKTAQVLRTINFPWSTSHYTLSQQ